MDQRESAFLGTGWSFPPTFDPNTSSVRMVSDEEDIRQSLTILLTTIPGERVMRPRYGCDLLSQVFESIDETTKTFIEGLITDAIVFFEPRIKLTDVRFEEEPEEGLLRIHLSYLIRTTNTRSNMVYPFYWKEGTHVTPL